MPPAPAGGKPPPLCTPPPPSSPAHPVVPFPSPRRCVSTSAVSAKREASASREQEETCWMPTSPRELRVTSPIVSVLTSTHSPPTKCTKAPSPLITCLSAPSGAWGASCLRRSTSASHTASPAIPVAKVARRAVALLTRTPTSSSSNSCADSKGIQLASRASSSSPRGVNPPLTSPNSSSRGKKASPTLGTGPIAARQFDRFPSRRLQEACLLSTRPQRLAAGRAPRTLLWRLLAPILGLPHLHDILDQLRP